MADRDPTVPWSVNEKCGGGTGAEDAVLEAAIPQWMKDRNQVAAAAGLEFSVRRLNDRQIRIRWQGSMPALMKLRALATDERGHLADVRDGGNGTGSLEMDEELPIRVMRLGEIEVATYQGISTCARIGYCATPDLLVARGIMPSMRRRPKGLSTCGRHYNRRYGRDDNVEWSARLLFDGRVLYMTQPYTEEFKQRRANTTPQVRKHALQNAPGVTVEEYEWGCLYAGRDENLRAAGLLPEGCEPGAPGMRKTTSTYMLHGRVVKARRSSGRRLMLSVRLSADEAEQRERRRRIEDARAMVERLANSEQEFRAITGEEFRMAFVRSLLVVADGSGGYEFTKGGLNQIVNSLREVYAAIARATVRFSKEAHAKQIDALLRDAGVTPHEAAAAGINGIRTAKILRFPTARSEGSRPPTS